MPSLVAANGGTGRASTCVDDLLSRNLDKLQQWSGFVRRLQLDRETPVLAAVGKDIAVFMKPLFNSSTSMRVWPPGGPWC